MTHVVWSYKEHDRRDIIDVAKVKDFKITTVIVEGGAEEEKKWQSKK